MKIRCPKCLQAVPAEQVNMGTDLAFCPGCSEGFKVSQSIDIDAVNSDLLDNPPKGAWFRQEIDRVVVGATTRSPVAFFLVPFMCVWSGGSLGGIYGSQVIDGHFNLYLSLFGIPFVLGSILFWTVALMAICGKVEVSIGRDSFVFVGIGRIGWTRRFDWSAVQTIGQADSYLRYPGRRGPAIIMEGTKRVKFATGLNEERRTFILHVLTSLKAQSRESIGAVERINP